MKKIYAWIPLALLIAGCGPQNGGDESVSEEMKSGVFFDGTVQGMGYQCSSGRSGKILQEGQYACPPEDRNITLTAGSRNWITLPWSDEIAPQTVFDAEPKTFLYLMRELVGADADRNFSNGIDVDPDKFGKIFAGDEEVQEYLQHEFSWTLPVSSSSSSVLTASSVSQASDENMSSSIASSVPQETNATVSSASSAEASSSSAGTSVSVSSAAVFPMTPYSIGSGKSDVIHHGLDVQAASSASSDAGTQPAPLRVSVPQHDSEPKNWYIRLHAEIPALKLSTSAASFGELNRPDALRNNSLKAIQPFSGTYVDIVFENPAGLGSGKYSSVFYPYRADAPQSWNFSIRTSASNATVLLSWSPLYVLSPYRDNYGRIRYAQHPEKMNPLLKKMRVVDEQSGRTLPAIQGTNLPVFRIQMNGQTSRRFRWELLTHNVNVSVPSAAPVRILSPKEPRGLSPLRKREPIFDLSRPPSFDLDAAEK